MGVEKAVLQKLSHLRNQKAVIVTIGNTLKGDDGAGPAVYEKLKGKVAAGLVDTGTVPENYIEPIIQKKPENLIIIDAIDFGSALGDIGIFKPEQLSNIVLSTHALSPHLFIDMIQAQLKVDVYLIGIQPAQTKMGQSLSEPVSSAVDRLAETLIEIFGC
jgi:hydrogenase 3 maturation protease